MRSLHRGGHVMKQLKIFGLVVTVMLASLGLTAGQQSPEPVVSVIRFSRVTRVPAAGEATTAMRLEVKDWALEKSPKGLQIPAQGFYIAQLRSGSVITTIAGKSRKRQAGDFWTVEGEQIMAVRLTAHCKAAQLRTIAINPGG